MFLSRSARRAGQFLLIMAMVATTVMLSSSPAEAQTGPECAAGVLVGSQCVIQGAPPVPGPSTCPVSTTVIEDGAECYTLVSPTEECPSGSFETASGECRKPVADQPGPLVCAAGYGLLDGECIRYEAPIPASCLNGDLVGSVCEIVGDLPQNGPSTCPVSATVFQDGNECYTLIAPPAVPASCDLPYFAFGSTCKTNNTGTTLEEIEAFTCPAGPAGVTITENLHTIGGIQKTESCSYTPIAPVGDCPAGTTPDPNGVDCRRPVALVPGPATCAEGFGLVNGQCLRFETPVGPSCENGTLEGNSCVILGDPPVPGPSTCPAGSLGSPGGCYIVVDAVGDCPAGTTPDPNGVDCRQPVALVPGALTCEAGFGLVDGACIRYEAPVYLCRGLVVTINMATGASGQGTAGDDVILGTSGADTIIARGGNDVICARGGDDLVYAGSGADTVYGDSGNDTIYGQSGTDTLRGNGGDDVLRGGNDNDVLRGGSGNDNVRGNAGDDDVRGNSGDDEVRGGSGDDALRGGSGTDSCIGGLGTDTANASCETTSSIP